MEPVGITYACTSVVVRNSSSRMVMVHSAIVLRGRSRKGSSGSTTGGTSVVTGGVSTVVIAPLGAANSLAIGCSGTGGRVPELKGNEGSVGSWGLTTLIVAESRKHQFTAGQR